MRGLLRSFLARNDAYDYLCYRSVIASLLRWLKRKQTCDF